MQFRITITHDRRQYRFLVQQLPSDASFDFYKVIAKNGFIILRNNGPVLRRHNLKHRRPEWKVTHGDLWNAQFMQKILDAVRKGIQSAGK